MLKGFFSIPVTFSSVYAPTSTLIVYVIFPNGKTIADSAVFSVSMCFRNKAELSFSVPKILPGSEVNLHLQAAPGSTCAVWAVDQTVFLLKPEKELSHSMIYGLFPSIPSTYSGYPHQVSEDDNSCGFQNSDQPDVFTAFREMGLKIMSNTNIRKPRLCLTTQSTTMMQERGMFTSRPMLMFAQPHKESNIPVENRLSLSLYLTLSQDGKLGCSAQDIMASDLLQPPVCLFSSPFLWSSHFRLL